MLIEKGGYDYFYNAMDKIGEEYYTKFKLSDEQVNKILMFIAISIIPLGFLQKRVKIYSYSYFSLRLSASRSVGGQESPRLWQ